MITVHHVWCDRGRIIPSPTSGKVCSRILGLTLKLCSAYYWPPTPFDNCPPRVVRPGEDYSLPHIRKGLQSYSRTRSNYAQLVISFLPPSIAVHHAWCDRGRIIPSPTSEKAIIAKTGAQTMLSLPPPPPGITCHQLPYGVTMQGRIIPSSKSERSALPL